MPRRGFVSVITPFLNAETFLAEAIESVLAQTYPRWELLLIDDGSVDGSTTIAQRYASRYPESIRYFQHEGHENRGMSASRNLGIRQSQGEYVAFLDADDVYLPEKLERQVRILATQPTAAMVYGPTQHWYSWTGRDEDSHRDLPRKLGVSPETLVQPPKLLPMFLKLEGQTPGTCGVLVRSDAIRRVGGFDDEFRGMFEDQVFFYKICAMEPVYVTGESWDRYRQHERSHSRISRRVGSFRSPAPSPSHHVFLKWLSVYLEHAGIEAEEVWQALGAELRPYRSPLHYQIALAGHRLRQLRDGVARFLPTPRRRVADELRK